MAIFYPRKQTVIIFLVCTITVVGFAYMARRNDSSASNRSVTANIDVRPDAPIPTNGDWKKQFLDTTSTSSFKTSGTSGTAKNVNAGNITATDFMGRSFITKYVDLKRQGLTEDTATVDDAANQIIADSLNHIEAPKAYTIVNFTIIPNADVRAYVNYNIALREVLDSYLPDHEHNEAVLAEKALDANDMSQLKAIDPVIVSYRAALGLLINMKVPKALAAYHAALMNGVNIGLYNAIALRNIEADPLKGMTAIGLEISGLQTISNALDGIRSEFQNAHVSFNNG